MSPDNDREREVVASPTTELPGGLVELDTLTAGLTHVTAGYLVKAPRPALVECGPALSIESVIAGLHALGLGADDLAYLVVSHIHLDHAGGAGDVAAAFPKAELVCHESGARHMVDPGRLNDSSKRVFGKLYDTVYGDCTPISGERIRAVANRETLDLGGGRKLELFHTPGHAKHHIGVFDPDGGELFVGDSVGVKLPGQKVIRPATPPADFDHRLAQRSLDLYLELQPQRLFLAHFGEVPGPEAALHEAKDQMRQWVDVAEQAWQVNPEIEHVADTLFRAFSGSEGPLTDDADTLNIQSGYHSNAAGLVRYFEQRAAGKLEAG